ncbi:MAG: GntR family transcriptional regulator [Spirochaetales bacterium]|jgi:DNA-binding GntR family transcriptional regulator|nr:GntR family transcriptional regulator [Spirochaetales bacterium]
MQTNTKISAKQRVYEIIKYNIINCRYLPNSYLSESMLTSELDTSRTPIREALTKLEQEGWISIHPQRGMSVSDLSINEIAMVYETRLLIEPYVAEKYGHAIDKTCLAELSRRLGTINGNINKEEANEIDNEFHTLITKFSKNRYFIRSMENLIHQSHRIRTMISTRWDDDTAEHIAIASAILDEDYMKAASYLQTHLENAKKHAYNLLIQNGGWITPHET